MTDGDGNEINGTAADQTLAFIKVNAELTENQNLTVSYEKREEEGDFTKNPNWSALADDVLYESWGARETIVLNHAWYFNDLVNLETTLYSTESSFKRELYTYDAGIDTTGFDIRNSSVVGDHSLTYGVEHKTDKVHAESYEDFSGLYNEEGTVTAFYAQDHWQVNDDLLVSFGVRHDSYELEHTAESVTWVKIDDVWSIEVDSNGDAITSSEAFSTDKQDGFSFNAGFVYNITNDLKLSAGYAQALRGRQIADAFTLGEVVHNEDLKPEEVENNEIGLEYNDGTFIFEVSAYVSTINDVVFDKFKSSVFYENVGDLETKGIELVAGYQADNFDILISYNTNNVELNNTSFVWPDASDSSGYSTVYLDGVDLEGYEYGGLGTTVGDSMNVSFNYEFNEQLTMGWNLNYVASVNDIEVFHRSMELGWVTQLETVSKPGYKVLDAFVTYEPIESVRIDLTVQNLLDETYRNHGSVADYGDIDGYGSIVGINEAGRDIRLSVSYTF